MAYGNKKILINQFDSMKKWVDYMHNFGEEEYLWVGGKQFGDWLGLDAHEGSYTGATDKTLIATAFYAHSTYLTQRTAEVLGYEKDAVYEQKVASVIAEAEGEILFVTDTFKFSVLEENGWLGRLRKAVSYLDLLQTVCLAGTAVILVLLLLCNLRQFAHMAYWLGLAGLIGGLLLLVPAVYIQATDFFSGFAIKDPQIFAAVVGFLQLLTQRALVMAIATAAAGLVLLVLFAVLHSHKEKAQES